MLMYQIFCFNRRREEREDMGFATTLLASRYLLTYRRIRFTIQINKKVPHLKLSAEKAWTAWTRKSLLQWCKPTAK
jgi:hypothetical protein